MSAAPTTGARPATRTRGNAALTIALLALIAAICVPARSDAAQAPKGFFGVHPLAAGTADFGEMADNDVGFIRTGFVVHQANSESPWPADPTYDWTTFDAIVAGAAGQGIGVLPVVLGTPGDTERGSTPLDSPEATAAWKDYLANLVRRYGPDGDFWDENPLVPVHPIEDWQVWNEPNSFNNWADPDPTAYGKLLSISAKAIHAEDPGADIVAAGVISQPVKRRAEDGDVYLRKMLRSRAAARAADTIAIHPYTGTVREVRKQIRLTRAVLDKAKLESTPIWVTEIGWGEGSSSNPLIVSAAKQRRNLRDSFRMMLEERKKLNIGRAVWYQWKDGPDSVCGWCSTAGLLEEDGTPKDLLGEFAAIARR